jgi:hypothetical protein
MYTKFCFKTHDIIIYYHICMTLHVLRDAMTCVTQLMLILARNTPHTTGCNDSLNLTTSEVATIYLTEVLSNSHVERQDVDSCDTSAALREMCHNLSRKAKIEKLSSLSLCEELRSDRSFKHNIRDSVDDRHPGASGVLDRSPFEFSCRKT